MSLPAPEKASDCSSTRTYASTTDDGAASRLARSPDLRASGSPPDPRAGTATPDAGTRRAQGARPRLDNALPSSPGRGAAAGRGRRPEESHAGRDVPGKLEGLGDLDRRIEIPEKVAPGRGSGTAAPFSPPSAGSAGAPRSEGRRRRCGPDPGPGRPPRSPSRSARTAATRRNRPSAARRLPDRRQQGFEHLFVRDRVLEEGVHHGPEIRRFRNGDAASGPRRNRSNSSRTSSETRTRSHSATLSASMI